MYHTAHIRTLLPYCPYVCLSTLSNPTFFLYAGVTHFTILSSPPRLSFILTHLLVMPRAQTTKAPCTPPKKAKWTSADDVTLIVTLQDEQAKGNQADNSWKAVVWTACEQALTGSEERSRGAPKRVKGCQNHWSLVCILCFLRLHTL